MRFLALLVCVFLTVGCSEKENDPTGTWNVETSYYKATYKIEAGESGFDCQVISYNDGTRHVQAQSSSPIYLFKNVASKSIDGSTGATGKKGGSSIFSMQLLGPNRLKVIQHISGQKRTEIWKRNPIKNT